MSFSNDKNKVPKVILFKNNLVAAPQASSTLNHQINFPISGQGVFLFNVNNIDYFAGGEKINLMLSNSDKSDGLHLQISYLGLHLFRIKSGELLASTEKGLVLIDTAFYWLSLDSHNFAVRFGIGEARLETQILGYTFPIHSDKKEEKEREVDIAAQKTATRAFLESIEGIDVREGGWISPMKLLRDPIVQTVPLKVKSTDDLTMMDIATNEFLPKANLSAMGQKLYDNVSGKNFILDDADFPQFSKAIEYSIATNSCWCNEVLKKKPTEFGYLRITLGQNSGESPGIPYVMEIWPPGNYSPVHHHAGANAIIRVLHGEITVKLFPFLNGSEEFAVKTFSEGEVTWISPELNQIHQLKNLDHNLKTCITIQCYMYDIEDEIHYDYFNYINEKGDIEHFDPDSDADYAAFRTIIKKEWEVYLAKGG